MISDSEKKIFIETAIKYNVSKVFLFGSSIEKNSGYNDIDIGVEGIAPGKFFYFYSDLFKNLPKPVDLVDLGGISKINDIIRRNGIKIYG